LYFIFTIKYKQIFEKEMIMYFKTNKEKGNTS